MASIPLAEAPRGGVDSGFDGTFGAKAAAKVAPQPGTPALPAGSAPDANAGLGPMLEADDETLFRSVHNLVLRQERLARNRLALDVHWTRIRQGFAWSRLSKVQDQDVWRAEFAPGADNSNAVPNKAADLCSKIVETLMVDPPAPDPHAIDLGETAQRAAEMARQFLELDAGDVGTNDNHVFWNALDGSMVRASSFIHVWCDTTGGGYVPLQIKAHPLAQDPNQPDVAVSQLTGAPLPAADPILRYVATDEQGQMVQFVRDASQAGQQWLPRLRCDVLNREHVRTFPETVPVHDAEMVIILYYSTLGEAKRRWPDAIATLDERQLGALCDWVPNRYLAILPPALRARWKLATGGKGDVPGGSDDERLMFYYHVYRRATPATIGQYRGYPKGAEIVVSGAFGGFTIYKDTLSALVRLPTGGKEERCMEMPIVQLTPRMDPDDRDPTGFATIALFGGAHEASNTLLVSYLEALDTILHPAKFIPSTSPVQGWQIEQSRGTGTPVPVLSREDYPHYEDPRPLPPGLIQTVAWNYSQMESASGLTKPAMGANDQQEVSGISRNIAVRQAMVALSRSAQATMNAWSRFWRIKLQLVVKHFKAPQLIHYVGEDGSYKEEWFRGNDFAVIDRVSIQAGTGTMMPPAEKQQATAFAQQMRWISPDEAAEIARPTFADALGIADSPHEQRIERQVSLWLKGMPYPEWAQEWDQYAQQKQLYDQLQQQYQQAAQQYQLAAQYHAIVAGGPPPNNLGPESQNATAMNAYQMAVINANANPLPPAPPMPPQMPPPQMPWTPFAFVLPNDTEPEISQIRKRRISNLLSTTEFSRQPPQWQQPVLDEYTKMRQAAAIGFPSAQAAQQAQNANTPSGAAAGMTAFQPNATPQAQSAGAGVPTTPTNMQQQSPGRPVTAG